MAKVFISYSSKNQQIAECFIEFLQLGMGVDQSNIFCTVLSDTLITGEAFIERIREELKGCEIVISIITAEYLKSKFCLIEMGAAWVMSKHYFPLLLVPYERLNATPLQGVQMRMLNADSDISRVYDELYGYGASGKLQTAEFNKRLPEFINRINNIHSGSYIIEQDEDGYYEAVIESIRPVNDNYRCYGIKGHIADPPDGQEADSDWLFFWRNVFPDLQVGDRIRFKTSKSEVKIFRDLGRARNLYPDDLRKLD